MIFLALRRVRARPFSAAMVALAFAGATALIGWSSLTAATSQEENVHRKLHGRLQILYFTLPLEGDFRAPAVRDTFAEFADVTADRQRIRISHSIESGDPLGPRLVTAPDVRVDRGRRPISCDAKRCELLTLRGKADIGDRVTLGGTTGVVVGTGSIPVLRRSDELSREAYFVPSLPAPLAHLQLQHGSTVITTAAIAARRVHGYELGDLRSRLRVALTRLERGDPLVRGSAPFALLHDLAHRGKVARERLLLVAGEGAALILAFAVFLASARRRETELLDDQLAVLGASRRQFWVTRVVEVVTPCVIGVLVALGGLIVTAAASLTVAAAVTTETMVSIVAVAVVGALLLLVAQTPPRTRRLGVGTLELAALCSLGIAVWQAATTSALDPDRLAASGAAPMLLLVPALAFFAVGVLILRVVPFALRAAARVTRNAPAAVRLSFLTAARNPAEVAAATTFLAVALGASLFSLDYRATLDRQARDHGDFVVGASWRVRGARPAPMLRLDGSVEDAATAREPVPASVLAVPATRIPQLRGWRDDFSPLSRETIARRVRPSPARMSGLRLADDAQELRVRAHGREDFPRRLVFHVLRRDQRFVHVTVGFVPRDWQTLRAPVPARARGGQIVAIAFQPTYVPLSFQYDPTGWIELGPIEQRTAGGWSALPSIGQWIPSTSPDGVAGSFAPTRAGTRFELQGTRRPFIHPRFGLPPVRFGFIVGDVPALASENLARRAVDGLLVLDLEGIQVPVRVVGSARLFPTVVDRPSSFLVFDYDWLFASLNADEPGRASPTEALSFATQRPPHVALAASDLTLVLQQDPLAAGMRRLLGVAGIVGALLGLLGLALATRSALGSERLQLAEYEALGVPPTSLRRSAQLRLFALSGFGVIAALLGALLTGRLISAFVAVTGTARRPLPPIASVVAWPLLAAVVVAVAAAGAASALLLTRSALRETAARRLRA